MALENILSQEMIQRLGWTLLHFVWQATAMALLLAILLTILRKASANVRYIMACAALGLVVLLPIVTMSLVRVSTPQPIADIEPPPAPVVVSMQPMTVETPLAKVVEVEKPVKFESVDTAPTVSWKQRASEKLEESLPYLVTGWLIGVFGLSLWHLGGWAQLQRLKRHMVKPVNASLQVKLNELAARLRISRAVRLVESALVQVPTVVGWLRPVILLPASALTGLTTEQLEALLAHELAHIHRYDYLLNIMQTIVETLGFYHPAVWWISHKIRLERENCCDDLAVSLSGDCVRYARALASMEEIRADRNELAVAASGGNLFGRIRRLVGKNASDSRRAGWIPSVITILLIAFIAIPTSIALNNNVRIKDQKGSIASNKVVLKLVDSNSQPVVGARVGTSVDWSDTARNPATWFLRDGGIRRATRVKSDKYGKVALKEADIFWSVPPTEQKAPINVINKDHSLAALQELSREDLGTEVTLTLQPGCRVHGRLTAAAARKRQLFANNLNVWVYWRVHTPYRYAFKQGRFDFVLPSGRYKLRFFSGNPNYSFSFTLPILIKPGQRDLDLTGYLDGTSQLPETETNRRDREGSIEPNKVVLKLVDPNSQPVVGAWVGTFVDWSDIAESPPIWFLKDGRSYKASEIDSAAKVISNKEGKITLAEEELFKPYWPTEVTVPLTAIDAGHYLAGLRELSREDLGTEVTLKLQPGCRVHGRVTAATARKHKWSTKVLTVLVFWHVHWPCQYSSKEGRFEFVLPPGKYEVEVYAEDPDEAVILPIQIKPGQRDLDLTKYLDDTSLSPAAETEPSARFLLEKMLEHRARVKNLQYVVEDVIWRDAAATEVLIEEQIERMREKGTPERLIERMKQSLSQVPETRFQILKCTVDDAGDTKIELTTGTYDSSGNKVPREERHFWAWNGVIETEFTQRDGSLGSAILRNKPNISIRLGHPWREFTGTFCKFLKETVEAERPVSVEVLKDDTYCVAFDYKISRYVAIVDPSKGYTCALRESYNKQGQLNSRTTATYEEVAEGIWFPISGQREEFTSDGAVRYRSTAKSTQIRINDPAFNAFYFDVDIPKGAHARDFTRNAKQPEVYRYGEPRKGYDEIVQSGGKFVAGFAVDENGAPVLGVRVEVCGQKKANADNKFSWTFSSSFEIFNAVTDSQGRFAIELEEDGFYNLRFSPENHAGIMAYDVPIGTKDLKVTLPKGGTISGRAVRIEDGRKVPIPSVEVKAEQSDRGTYNHLGFDRDRKTVTDSQGRFQFNHLRTKMRSPETRNSQQWEYSPRAWTLSCEKTSKTVVFYEGANIEDIELIVEPDYANPIPLIGKPLPSFENIQIDFNPEQAKNKRMLVCFWDMNQRPSRRCISQLSTRAEQLKQKDVKIIAVHALKVDENTLNRWIKENDVPFLYGMVEGNIKQTRFLWSVRSLPWLILTDMQHIVRAEGFGLEQLDEKLQETSSAAQVEVKGLTDNSEVVEQAWQGKYEIFGTVYEPVPHTWWDDFFTKLETAESEDGFRTILMNMENLPEDPAACVPAADTVVTVQSNSFNAKTTTDAEGQFSFSRLPAGHYTLSYPRVTHSRTGEERVVIEKSSVPFDELGRARLELHSDHINVRGRITDAHGQPVAGAKVIGTKPSWHWIKDVDSAEVPRPVPFVTTSRADGSYELQGIDPPNTLFLDVSSYLVEAKAPDTGFILDIDVEVNGYEKNKVVQVPLVTEELLYQGRRFLEAHSKLGQRFGSEETKEKEQLPYPLPTSYGNTITGIDIVLERIGADVQVDSNEGRIEGRIIDIHTGKGIVGVKLAAALRSSPKSNDRYVCTSEGDGTFAIGGLRSGEYRLQGDFPSVDVGVTSGQCIREVLIGVDRRGALQALKETTAEQQSDVKISMGVRVIEMPADAMKEAFESDESLSSELLVRNGYEIVDRLLTLTDQRKDAKLIANPNVLMRNNGKATVTSGEHAKYISGYESTEGTPSKLTAQHKMLEAGFKYTFHAGILESSQKVHIELAVWQQKLAFETRQHRAGYDYQIPSPPEIFVTEMTTNSGEPMVIGRLRQNEPAMCLIVTLSVLMPEPQPESLLGKKLPEPANMEVLKQIGKRQALICFWDMNQRPSRNMITELAKRSKELQAKGIFPVLVHTSLIEPAKLNEWLDNREILFSYLSITEAISTQELLRWGVRAQPWLILTDQEGIVRAEGLSLEQLDEKLQESSTDEQFEDHEEKAPATKEYEVVQLSHVNAEEAAECINEALRQMPDIELGKTVLLKPLARARQIIIFGRKDVCEIVKKLVEQLDTLGSLLEIRVFQLKYTDPDLIKERIEGSNEYPANEPQEKVRVISFPTMKQVTVIASPENMSRIAKQIATWDVFQVFKPRIIKLQNSDPVQMARLLTTLFDEEDEEGVNICDVILGEDAEEKYNIVGPLRSHFTFEGVPGTTKIIVISNIPGAYDAVVQWILELDQQKMATKDVKEVREWMAGLAQFDRQVKGSAERLKCIGRALLMYANDHDGKYPDMAKPHELREYLKTEELAWPKQYEYLAGGRTTTDPPDIVIYHDADLIKYGKGTNVLFNDGHVEFVNPEKLNDLNINKTSILIEMRILTAGDDFMNHIGLDPNSPAKSEGWSDYRVHTSGDSVSFIIDPLHADLLIKTATAHKDVAMLAGPQLCAMDGRPATIYILDTHTHSLIPSDIEPNSPSAKTGSKLESIKLGTSIRLEPDALPNGKTVNLEFEWEYRRLLGVKKHTGPDKQTQKVPQIATNKIVTSCPIPDGKTLLIVGKKITEPKKKEPKKFGLADLPLIGFLFYTPTKIEETKNLLILVKPVINPQKRVQDQRKTE